MASALSINEAELRRLVFIVEQVTALAGQWHNVSDADEAPEHGYDALVMAARDVEDVLKAAGAGAPADHLAEIERHLAALKAELTVPLPQRHSLRAVPSRDLNPDERVRWDRHTQHEWFDDGS
jgi:hypothetical protein